MLGCLRGRPLEWLDSSRALPVPPVSVPASGPRSGPGLTGAYGEHLLEVGGDRHLFVELRRLGQEGAVLEVGDGEHVGAALRRRRDDLRRVDLHETLPRVATPVKPGQRRSHIGTARNDLRRKGQRGKQQAIIKPSKKIVSVTRKLNSNKPRPL